MLPGGQPQRVGFFRIGQDIGQMQLAVGHTIPWIVVGEFAGQSCLRIRVGQPLE